MRTSLAVMGLFLSSSVLVSVGCKPTNISGSGNQGVAFQEQECQGDPTTEFSQNPTCLPNSKFRVIPNTPVWGTYTGIDQYDASGVDLAHGSVTSFGSAPGALGPGPLQTPGNAPLIVNNGRAPGEWNVFFLSIENCGVSSHYVGAGDWNGGYWDEYEYTEELIPNYYDPTNPGLVFTMDCINYDPVLPASRRVGIIGNLPQTLTLGSEVPFTTTNGMPLLYIYNESGALVSTETATSISSDGSQATFPFPSSLPQSGYSLAVANQINSSGTFQTVGTNLLSIVGSQTIAGNPFGIAAGGLYTSTSYNPIPIMSLYSQGQVLIGNTPVTVGTNPTAIAVYPTAPEGSYSNSTEERAVVATLAATRSAFSTFCTIRLSRPLRLETTRLPSPFLRTAARRT